MDNSLTVAMVRSVHLHIQTQEMLSKTEQCPYIWLENLSITIKRKKWRDFKVEAHVSTCRVLHR